MFRAETEDPGALGQESLMPDRCRLHLEKMEIVTHGDEVPLGGGTAMTVKILAWKFVISIEKVIFRRADIPCWGRRLGGGEIRL